MGTPSLQSRPDKLADSLASPRVATGDAPQKARHASVEAALAVGLGLVLLSGRVESLSDDLVQQPGHASIRVACRLLEAGFHR
jgi:hypothetical protein